MATDSSVSSTPASSSLSGGPAAPKDPIARRSSFYLFYETMIEGKPHPRGGASHELYLEGRIVDQARNAGNITDEAILELLKTCDGFRKLVHSIGIVVKTQDPDVTNVTFTLQNWGKTQKFDSGTRLSVTCPTDGNETLLVLEDCDWSQDDDIPGIFSFGFEQVASLATANILLYLHDEYEVPEPVIETPVPFGTLAYREMIAKSLLHQGNTKRLKTAIAKAKRGEEVTIAYIGGSITQGAGAAPINTRSYAYQSYLRFKEMFAPHGGDNVRLIKAGVGGTPSELGMIRYDRDVLRDGTAQPDIVVIEFAVNDAGDETEGNCFESLVLKALNGPGSPAVILLFSVFVNDWNLQDRLAPVGWHYNLPMVSVKDAVVEQFTRTKAEGNLISKRQFFYDIYHPTNDGHTVMADCLAALFEMADRANGDEEDIEIAKPPVIGNDYASVQLLDRQNGAELAHIEVGSFTEVDADLQMAEMDDQSFGSPQFPHNWMRNAQAGGESFRMTMESRSLVLVFKDSGNPAFGSAEIWVDGRLVRTANPHENNWTHCNAVIAYQEPDSRQHVVEIRMAPGHEDKVFTILGFGYVK